MELRATIAEARKLLAEGVKSREVVSRLGMPFWRLRLINERERAPEEWAAAVVELNQLVDEMGSITRVAEMLGVHRVTLSRRLAKAGFKRSRWENGCKALIAWRERRRLSKLALTQPEQVPIVPAETPHEPQ